MYSLDFALLRLSWHVRQRAAALITQGDRVLLHQLDGDHFWDLPGGAIGPGESTAETLSRELHEELGTDMGNAVVVAALAVGAENFFTSAGVAHHEIGSTCTPAHLRAARW